jgi:DNA-binding PadR family transcriptional regulator
LCSAAATISDLSILNDRFCRPKRTVIDRWAAFHYAVDRRYIATRYIIHSMSTSTFQILLALSDAPRHGYAMMQEVERLSKGKARIGPGTLYGALQRLLEEGLIEECDAPASEPEPNERRRYYRLTREGKQAVAGEARRLQGLVEMAQ